MRRVGVNIITTTTATKTICILILSTYYLHIIAICEKVADVIARPQCLFFHLHFFLVFFKMSPTCFHCFALESCHLLVVWGPRTVCSTAQLHPAALPPRCICSLSSRVQLKNRLSLQVITRHRKIAKMLQLKHFKCKQ